MNIAEVRAAIDAAGAELAKLRGDKYRLEQEVARLESENARLREQLEPCHYCERTGWHEEDCPTLLDEVAASLPIG